MSIDLLYNFPYLPLIKAVVFFNRIATFGVVAGRYCTKAVFNGTNHNLTMDSNATKYYLLLGQIPNFCQLYCEHGKTQQKTWWVLKTSYALKQ